VRYLGAAAAPHLVLFLDACRNVVDAGKSVGAALAQVDVQALCPPGVVSFCSCRPGAVSYETDDIKSGIFTQALCAALGEKGRCRTIYELDAYLSAQVPALASAHGKPTQQPHSRVEPLGVQQLEIVSARKRNEWRAATPIGAERRPRSVQRAVPPDTVIDPLVAVDFGTSYSVVSWYRPDGEVLLLPGPDGRPLVPSVVHFLPDLDYLVGGPAVEADPYRPAATIRHVKRALGTSTSYQVEGRSIAPELAASLVLRSLRRNAEEALGTPVRRCLASHPANFTLRQIEALERAFALADFHVLRMIGEPNVAALLIDQTSGRGDVSCLVVDLGGGTFDVALVESGEGVAEIRNTAGSNEVGGLDFDLAVMTYAERELRETHGWAGELTPAVRDKLRREAERAKRDLGRREATTLLLQDLEDGTRGLVDISIDIDRTQFRAISAHLNDEIRATLISALSRLDFGYTAKQWLATGGVVLLAGQGAKIFTVREQIENVLPGVPVLSKYQETAVVQGLGLQCGVLTGGAKDLLLLNTLRFGVGVRCQNIDTRTRGVNELSEHAVSPDPSRNREVIQVLDSSTTIPTYRFEGLRLTGQPGTLHELEIVELPLSADLVLGRIPAVATGNKIELRVDVDASGIVIFIVKDLNNDVRTAYNLNGPDDRLPWSDGMVSVPLHRLRRVEGDAEAETGKPAAGTPEIGTSGSRWRIWQRRGGDRQ
jgi:molecular chaperone DnaK (HSP70)